MSSSFDSPTEPQAQIRAFRDSDFLPLQEILTESFDGVCIDQAIESELGNVAGHDWKWRKGRDLGVDLQRDRNGVLVADINDCPIGLITTWQDTEAGIGHIPNLAIASAYRGLGIGRTLIRAALERFRCAGLGAAKIETMVQNERGNGLYTSEGFVEIARQIHFIQNLPPSGNRGDGTN